MNPPAFQEHRLAVMTSWGFLGSFGFCLVLSGFADRAPLTGCTGFAAFIAAFVAHVIINRIFGADFTNAQIALGLSALTVGILSFIASCLFDPAFGETNILVGLLGFGAITTCLVAYVMINYGVRGGYAMVHRLHMREHRRS